MSDDNVNELARRSARASSSSSGNCFQVYFLAAFFAGAFLAGAAFFAGAAFATTFLAGAFLAGAAFFAGAFALQQHFFAHAFFTGAFFAVAIFLILFVTKSSAHVMTRVNHRDLWPEY